MYPNLSFSHLALFSDLAAAQTILQWLELVALVGNALLQTAGEKISFHLYFHFHLYSHLYFDTYALVFVSMLTFVFDDVCIRIIVPQWQSNSQRVDMEVLLQLNYFSKIIVKSGFMSNSNCKDSSKIIVKS